MRRRSDVRPRCFGLCGEYDVLDFNDIREADQGPKDGEDEAPCNLDLAVTRRAAWEGRRLVVI